MVPITKKIVPASKYSKKCPYWMEPWYVVVHNTANDATAKGEVTYMTNNNSSTSFHYAVDDTSIVQAIPENRNAFHAGDGSKGNGNRHGIGIEICYSKSGGNRFLKAEDNAVDLIVSILKQYGWGIDHVKKHQDFSGKYCPHRTLDMGWQRFLNKIQDKLSSKPIIQKPEGLTMGQYEELKSRIDGLDAAICQLTTVYNNNNMPAWAKSTVEKLQAKGILQGDDQGLKLSYDMIRTLVIMDRTGMFN